MKQKVLSLLSSTTEIIYALGCGDRLVGRSHECDYPEAVSKLPICTFPKFNVEGTSREVDDEVKSLPLDEDIAPRTTLTLLLF